MSEEIHYYETTILLKVLSDRPVPEVTGPNSLAMVVGECINGDFVGNITMCRTEEVNANHMAELLVAADSEANFFDLPDIASTVEELIPMVESAVHVVPDSELRRLLDDLSQLAR